MAKNTTAIGSTAEDMAAEYLQSKGFRVIARNHRTRFAELDIIAASKDVVAFVEVKYRKHTGFGGGAGAITQDKLRRLHNAAEVWLSEHEEYAGYQPRIDAITVEGDLTALRIEHLVNIGH
jgi:putative endonuclease